MATKELVEITLGNENGNAKMLPEDFSYQKIELPEYEWIHGKGDKHIIRTAYDSSRRIDDYSKVVRAKNSNLLHDLIMLRIELPSECFAKPDHLNLGIIEFDEDTERKAAEMIISWCKKHGYPFPIEKQGEGKKTKPLFELGTPAYIYFDITDFLLNLNEIYSYFILYRIVTNSQENLDESLSIFSASNDKRLLRPALQVIESGHREKEIETYLDLLEKKYQTIHFSSHLVMTPKLHFETETHSLFDAAFYQLALLLPLPEEEYRKCPKCEKWFKPKSRRQIYCNDPCTRQAAYSERERKKKRAAKHKSSAAEKN